MSGAGAAAIATMKTDAFQRRGLGALKWAAFGVACWVFWRAIAQADFGRVAASVSAIGPVIAVVLLPFLVAMSFDVLGWRHLYAGLGRNIPFAPFLACRLAGEAILLSLPGGQVVAEPMAPYLLRERCGVPLAEGFAGLGLKKALFSIAHGALIFGGAVIGWGALVRVSPLLVGGPWLPWAIAGIGFLVMAAFAGGVYALLRGSPARRLIDALAASPIAVLRRFADARRDAFVSTDRHLAAAWSGARVERAFALFMGFWLVEAAETWLILHLLGASLSFSEVMSFEAAVSLARALAFFVPAGLGVQDLGYMAMLRALGVADATTVGAAFVMIKRVKELFWIAVGYVLLLATRTPRGAVVADT